jgi:hypothetical protein
MERGCRNWRRKSRAPSLLVGDFPTGARALLTSGGPPEDTSTTFQTCTSSAPSAPMTVAVKSEPPRPSRDAPPRPWL